MTNQHDPTVLGAAATSAGTPHDHVSPGVPAPGHAANNNVGMSFVLDVPVEVTIELGRRNMRIADVLRLGPGSTLELDKVSGDPLDIYVNNQLIARGEAVVIGERYGVRLTEVLVSELEAHR
jgi:flagellar motor switch protein FliN